MHLKVRMGGFTLVEVLVAVLVLGVGLLGIVTLQSRSLQYNQQAYLYSQAVFLANDVAERMRANTEQLGSYEIDYGTTVTGVSLTQCMSTNCSELQIARWDLAVWKNALAAALPGGDGSITRLGSQFVITTQFENARDGEGPQEIAVTVQL